MEAKNAAERQAEANATASNINGRQRAKGQEPAARSYGEIPVGEGTRGSGDPDARGDRSEKGEVKTKADANLITVLLLLIGFHADRPYLCRVGI